jgi:DNA-binding transcriptional MerR regulator
MDEGTGLLKARDLAGRAGLPEANVRRYLRTFGEFFTSVKQGRARLYPPDAADRLKQIAELEAMGTTAPTIRGILGKRKAGEGDGNDAVPVIPAGSIADAGENLTLGVLSDVKSLQEEVAALREKVAMLQEKAAEQEQRLIGHQQQIRLLRHDVDEQKTDTMARRMEARNTPLWRRLFHGKDVPRR